MEGPVFEISALTREGCEALIHAIYRHVQSEQRVENAPVEVDPRFAGDSPFNCYKIIAAGACCISVYS